MQERTKNTEIVNHLFIKTPFLTKTRHSLTRRFQMEVLLMPTVGLATEVNKNLLISIPEREKQVEV